MHELRKLIRDWSHSVRGIRNGCILIVGLGVMMAAGVRTVAPAEAEGGRIQRLYRLHRELVRESNGFGPSTPSLSSPVSTDGPDFVSQWLDVLMGMSAAPPGPGAMRGLRFAYGLGALHQGDVDRALVWMQAENDAYPDSLVRRVVLRTALSHQRMERIGELLEDPAYAKDAEGSFLVSLGMERGDWGMILRNFWKAEYGGLRVDALILSLVAGAVWTGMIAGLYPSAFQFVYLLPILAALALGWMSTWPTIWSAMWLDNRFGLSEGTDFISALAYYLVSVGLREEVCKVLLYAPLLVWTARRNRDAEALILGALVGLGFAIEENITYLSGPPDGTLISRFVSANILHFTLTGATALALTRVVRDPGKWFADSIQVLGWAIGLHAIYNTLIAQPVPGLGDMSYFSGTALAGCVYLFFREAATLCPPRRRVLSQTALFCWGFCLILNLEMVQAAVTLPWRDALNVTGGAALAGLFSGYIFLHRVREPLGK
jgi:RsiW-degrading membrane proteinase PrsW (M82 family)